MFGRNILQFFGCRLGRGDALHVISHYEVESFHGSAKLVLSFTRIGYSYVRKAES